MFRQALPWIASLATAGIGSGRLISPAPPMHATALADRGTDLYVPGTMISRREVDALHPASASPASAERDVFRLDAHRIR